ncbi:multidrug effflux MFS transporter [Microbacterium sp. NPDC076911]|uniref:multidrug effflux MFS transporter n=1 Tax=Microbacterium sp. NPDC076911 TaxID=3154958 RepID=UPI003414CD33
MNRTSRSTGLGPLLLVTLALLASVAPFSTDLYLSAFPVMAEELNTSAATIQLTLTSFLIGLAIGQLVFGPISDRVGRRGPLLIGSTVFVLASVAVMLAPSVELLIAARLLQGVSGAAGMVLGRAVVADREKGDAAARAFSLMMIVGGIAPVIAPLAGSLVLDQLGWRGVLGVLVALSVVMLLGSWFVVKETLPREQRSAAGTGRFRLLLSARYLTPAATFVFGFSVMMAYISASPFLYQDVIGLEPTVYGMFFGLNALGLAGCSFIGSRLLRRFTARTVLGWGVIGLVGSTTAVLALALSALPAAWLMLPIFVSVASLGFVMGPATALALSAVPGASGTGSAVLGASQFGFAAIVSPLVGLGGSEATLPLAVVMFTMALLAAAAHISGRFTAVVQKPSTTVEFTKQ